MRQGSDEAPRSKDELDSLTPRTQSLGWASATGRGEDQIRHAGSQVGPYLVLEQLGIGGMGVVYAAYDPKLDRKIALKVLRSAGHDESAEVARLRLVSEGRALAQVSHPNVVTVFDVGTVEAEVYVAMELVDGETLGQWRKHAARPWPAVVEMFSAIAAGLAAVHDAGLVHRDVKPDNVLVDAEGRPRVTDFGLARPERESAQGIAAPHPALEDADTPLENVRLTQTGARLGTPAYMASEQLQGRPATPKSDQFALCVALWEALYGERPFAGGSWVSLVVAVSEGQIREPPTPPSGRPVPGWLRRIAERGLAADPDDRWPDLRALRDALRAGDPARARRRWLWTLAAVGTTATIAGGVAWQGARTRAAAEADCETVGDRVHTVWSDDARGRLRNAFNRSEIDDAMGIEASVETVLDTFAAAWTTERQQVCLGRLDTPADTLLERRAECLENRLETLSTLLNTFSSGDDVIVSRARRSAEGLTDLERCSDEDRLLRRPPLPEAEDARAQVRDVDRRLGSTLVHEHVGRYDEGLAISRAALEDARAIEHRPTVARASYRVAVFEEKLGHYPEAVEHWVVSFREASLSGDDDLASQAASALAFTEGYQLKRYDTGVRWSELSGILLERLGKTKTLDEARRLDVLAVLTEMKGQLDEAVTLHRASIALRESLVPATHQSIGYGLANLAAVLRSRGDLDEAETALLRSRAIFENAFGPDNPTTAHVLSNLAALYQEQGRYDEADILHQRVLEIWLAQLGPDHPDVADVYLELGDSARARGSLDAAIEQYQHAETVYAAAGESQRSARAKAAWKRGRLLVLRGRVDQAAHALDTARETLAALGPDEDRLRGKVRLAQGWLAYDRDEREAAGLHFERARALLGSSGRWAEHALNATATLQTDARETWRATVANAEASEEARAEAQALLVRTSAQDPAEVEALERLLVRCRPDQAATLRRRAGLSLR